jgi:hypothetical protein
MIKHFWGCLYLNVIRHYIAYNGSDNVPDKQEEDERSYVDQIQLIKTEQTRRERGRDLTSICLLMCLPSGNNLMQLILSYAIVTI